MLVRHPAAALRWRGRCYGASDVGLSLAGRMQAAGLVKALVDWRPEAVLWSGLRRTGVVAVAVARRTGARLVADPRWQERNFGAWEGRTWDAIYRESGDAMDGMLNDSENFRPGGGETTAELCRRAEAAWRDRPRVPRLVIVAHGGPIAAVRALLAGAPPSELVHYIPETGAIVRIAQEGANRGL